MVSNMGELAMKENLKMAGYIAIFIALAIGSILLIALFIKGGIWISERIYPWLAIITGIALFITIFCLLPTAIFKRSRGFAGAGLLIASYVFGVTLWVSAFLLTYTIWGGVALIVGLFLMGIGIVPIAMLATAFVKQWSIFGQLILLLVMTFETRLFGYYLISNHEEYKTRQLTTG